MDLIQCIADAIKEADDSYFFENYSNQALNILFELKSNNFSIVPITPTEEMLEAGKEAIMYGRQKPADVVEAVYKAMINAFLDKKNNL